MTLKKDGKSPVEKSEVGSNFEEDHHTSPVPTRVGRNTVHIDVPALKHLVDTVKDKLKP